MKLTPERLLNGYVQGIFPMAEADGTIYWCNDLEAVTWSQDGATPPPLPMTRSNMNYLAVCFRGDFRGKGHKGGKPTEAQLDAARALWTWLRHDLDLPEDMLFGHSDFGKGSCPGTDLSKVITDICGAGLDVKGNLPRTIEDWQRGLVRLGCDLGDWGKKKDGVDGDWGEDSQVALEKWQTSEGLATGTRDAPTSTGLAIRLAELPPPPKSKGRGKPTHTAPAPTADKSEG